MPTNIFGNMELAAASKASAGVVEIAANKALANAIDDKLVYEWVKETPEIVVGFEPRVVTQSIKPGTPVKKGTAIDLVLGSKDTVPGGIIEGVHVGFKEWTLDQIESSVLKTEMVKSVVDKYASAAEIKANEDDFAVLMGAFETAGIPIDEGDPKSSFEAAFKGVKATQEFVK